MKRRRKIIRDARDFDIRDIEINYSKSNGVLGERKKKAALSRDGWTRSNMWTSRYGGCGSKVQGGLPSLGKRR